jgi:serine/threonine protein kinase
MCGATHVCAGFLQLDGDGLLKLSDFSLASTVTDAKTSQSLGKRVTPAYMAPELFEDDGVSSFASDLWALGCVCYELAAGRPPFMSTTFKELLDAILNVTPQPLNNITGQSPWSTADHSDARNGVLVACCMRWSFCF